MGVILLLRIFVLSGISVIGGTRGMQFWYVFLYTVYIYLLQQLQQQNLSLPQFVLVQPGHPIATPLQPAQVIISQTPQAQQSKEMQAVFSLQLLYYI